MSLKVLENHLLFKEEGYNLLVKIILKKKKIEYTLRKSRRARVMRLAIYPGGAFVVTAPWWASQGVIERFIVEKAKWVLRKIEYLKQFPVQVFPRSGKREFAKHKDAALTLAKTRIDYFNRHYNFNVKKIAIRNQKTRWGSASRKGNLNFNYKIALLPSHLADYIVVHELCHLGAFNHSQKFWSLVAQTIPNHQALRRELKLLRSV
jgi:predicted metal-dependent hydrolase